MVQALESQKRRKSVSPNPRVGVDHHHPVDNKELAMAGGEVRSNSSVADVEVKILGPNVIVKVISHRIPGILAKIIAVLERLAFQVLHLNISTIHDTVIHDFVLKVKLHV